LQSATLPERLTEIDDDAFDDVDSQCKFEVVAGSYAEEWARKHGFRVETRKRFGATARRRFWRIVDGRKE